MCSGFKVVFRIEERQKRRGTAPPLFALSVERAPRRAFCSRSFFAAGRVLSSPVPPAAPFLPAAEEMGERTPPKTNGFWISFWSLLMQWEKVPQGIGHGPILAAADVVGS
jgi:hypothetical protein